MQTQRRKRGKGIFPVSKKEGETIYIFNRRGKKRFASLSKREAVGGSRRKSSQKSPGHNQSRREEKRQEKFTILTFP